MVFFAQTPGAQFLNEVTKKINMFKIFYGLRKNLPGSPHTYLMYGSLIGI